MLTPLRPRTPTGKYVVKKGDCLSRIAEIEYGNFSVSDRIVAENRLKSPHRIYVGQVLKLPILNSSASPAVRTFHRAPCLSQGYAKEVCNPAFEFNSKMTGQHLSEVNGVGVFIGKKTIYFQFYP